jgi:hypothetical protein
LNNVTECLAAEIDEGQVFSQDPYVALPSTEAEHVEAAKKRSVDEILANIHGYQPSSNGSSGSALLEKPVMGAATHNPPPSSPPRSPPPSSSSPVEDNAELEIDINNFCIPAELDACESVVRPAPIRNAFDLDSDFFDSCGAQPTLAKSTSDDQYFLAKEGETVFVDGKAGYSHIDLSFFDLSAASFQANQITIKCDDGTHFQVDYRNVPFAVFAGGKEVELAANEVVSPS